MTLPDEVICGPMMADGIFSSFSRVIKFQNLTSQCQNQAAYLVIAENMHLLSSRGTEQDKRIGMLSYTHDVLKFHSLMYHSFDYFL